MRYRAEGAYWLVDRRRPLRPAVVVADLSEAGAADELSHLIRSVKRLPNGPYQVLMSVHIPACLLGEESASLRTLLWYFFKVGYPLH